ncbi:sigma-70 family RNA polymerase sigma factor [Teredinibacter turnerae]|uniref:sigma-70 family RNA polymerase sigma factor n=1 Tax=Teredinibacter turnerae TaxID=2426 RepID=UPI00036C04ED|nr:sigma-70 family RNA polymerase sigma factor [Teredinibacter turnerae]
MNAVSCQTGNSQSERPPEAGDLDKARLDSTKLRESLFNYLSQRLPANAPVDDLLQDLFVKALERDAKAPQIRNLTGWLYAAARTTIADFYRAQAACREEVLQEDLAHLVDDDLSFHSALSECLIGFIGELPGIYREALLAADIRGESMRDLAEQEGVSPSAIKSRAARGRRLLRDKVLNCCAVEIADGLVDDYYVRRCGIASQALTK